MSGELITAQALNRLSRFLEGRARQDLEVVIGRLDPRFAQFVYELGWDAGLARPELHLRAVALFYQFASIQLADDLADGDCSYLPDSAQSGPGAQWILQHCYHQALSRTRLKRGVQAAMARDFIEVGAGQQDEVRTRQFHYDSAEAGARRLNGCQYRAYFRAMFAGTEGAARASEAGFHFGIAVHVAGDRSSGDRRWTDLNPVDQARLLELARASSPLARQAQIPSVNRRLSGIDRLLMAPLPVSHATSDADRPRTPPTSR